ncbi:hypothetical protein M8C21_018525, partial [Ambrosia artemisiifolia]
YIVILDANMIMRGPLHHGSSKQDVADRFRSPMSKTPYITVGKVAYPWLAEREREQICRLMNIQKLSLDASMHAAQNERLPLRVIVQVLFFEQLRMRTSIAGWFFLSENEDQMRNKNEGEEVRVRTQGRMREMRERVLELERECEKMKFEIQEVQIKKSWIFFCKRRRHWRF